MKKAIFFLFFIFVINGLIFSMEEDEQGRGPNRQNLAQCNAMEHTFERHVLGEEAGNLDLANKSKRIKSIYEFFGINKWQIKSLPTEIVRKILRKYNKKELWHDIKSFENSNTSKRRYIGATFTKYNTILTTDKVRYSETKSGPNGRTDRYGNQLRSSITTYHWKTEYTLWSVDGKKLETFNQNPLKTSEKFSARSYNEKILTIYKSAELWNSKGNVIATFDTDPDSIRSHGFSLMLNTIASATFNPKGNRILIVSLKDKIKLWALHKNVSFDQILLKKIICLYLRMKKPSTNITTTERLLKSISADFNLDYEELKEIWNSFPDVIRKCLWNKIKQFINKFGKQETWLSKLSSKFRF